MDQLFAHEPNIDKFPMHRAAEEGNLEKVRQLVEFGVNVDSRDDWGRTALHWAAKKGRYEVADLLSKKCDLNLKDKSGLTPVLKAGDSVHKNVVDLLLQRGAQLNCRDNDNITLLHMAAAHGWTDIVHRIVESGEVDVNTVSISCGYTPLLYCAAFGHVDVISYLIRAGADVRRSNYRGRTALHMAVSEGHPKAVQLLIEEHKLDLNAQDWFDRTPLHDACFGMDLEIIKQLLEAGADTNIKDCMVETALATDLYCPQYIERYLERMRLLVQYGAFFQEGDYAKISQDPLLKENVLKDVDLCTQSVVNKFNRHSLPALYSNPNFAGMLPSIKTFELNPRHIHDLECAVKFDIETNGFCNVIKARPSALSALCVLSLITTISTTNQSAIKRPASPDVDSDEDIDFLDSPPLKKLRLSRRHSFFNGGI